MYMGAHGAHELHGIHEIHEKYRAKHTFMRLQGKRDMPGTASEEEKWYLECE